MTPEQIRANERRFRELAAQHPRGSEPAERLLGLAEECRQLAERRERRSAERAREESAPPEKQAWTPAPLTMSDAELNTAAREWVSECTWKEDPEDLEDLTDAEVRRGVNRHYEGGWQQFVQDTNGYIPPPILPTNALTWPRSAGRSPSVGSQT